MDHLRTLEELGLSDEQLGTAFRLFLTGAAPNEVLGVEAGGATVVGRVVDPSPTARIRRPAGFPRIPVVHGMPYGQSRTCTRSSCRS